MSPSSSHLGVPVKPQLTTPPSTVEAEYHSGTGQLTPEGKEQVNYIFHYLSFDLPLDNPFTCHLVLILILLLSSFPYSHYQVIQGIRLCSKSRIITLGDPMLQPICTYENSTLVRALYRLSCYLNHKVGLK